MSATADPHRSHTAQPPARRARAVPPWRARPWLYRIPLLGRIAWEVIEGDSDNIYYLAVTLATLWILAIVQWGLPALALPMVLLAPVCLVMLVLLTLG